MTNKTNQVLSFLACTSHAVRHSGMSRKVLNNQGVSKNSCCKPTNATIQGINKIPEGYSEGISCLKNMKSLPIKVEAFK